MIGNPIGLWSTITDSVNEVIDHTKQKQFKKPLDNYETYLNGINYVMKKTSIGLINSANQINNSVSNVLSLLTFDENYINMRQYKKF